ncbi:transposase [Nocardioides ginsengisegetis]
MGPAIIVAEVDLDMSRFPTLGYLCSWAKTLPRLKSSAGKTKGNDSTGHDNLYLARVLVETAVVIGRSDTLPRRAVPTDRASTWQREGHRLRPAARSS